MIIIVIMITLIIVITIIIIKPVIMLSGKAPTAVLGVGALGEKILLRRTHSVFNGWSELGKNDVENENNDKKE